MTEKVIIGDCELWHGDCREVLPLVFANCLITDPPYGLGELSGTTSKTRNKNAYDASFEDTEQYVNEVVVPAISAGLERCGGRGLVTSGVRCMFNYPKPRAIGGFYQPAAVGMSPWGFAGYNPVLFYGKDPRDGKGQNSVMTTLTQRSDDCGHPCPKPIKAMEWMVAKGTMQGETVLDLFMGSGSTGVACVNLGRKFVGVELERKYFEIACERITRAYAQPRLFEDAKPAVQVQVEML